MIFSRLCRKLTTGNYKIYPSDETTVKIFDFSNLLIVQITLNSNLFELQVLISLAYDVTLYLQTFIRILVYNFFSIKYQKNIN